MKKTILLTVAVLFLAACAKEPTFSAGEQSLTGSDDSGAGGFPSGLSGTDPGTGTGTGTGTSGGTVSNNPGSGFRTLNMPLSVVWKTSGQVCRPYGYLSDNSVGHSTPCSVNGQLTTVEWASALPQPNGCPEGQATVFTNTYVCRVCPGGHYRVVYRDVVIPPGFYPSGWQTPAHVIPSQPIIVCQ